MRNEIVHYTIPNIPICVAGRRNARIGSRCDIHYHNEIEIFDVSKGCMSFTVNNKAHLIREGEVAFFNSRVPHSSAAMEDGTLGYLIQIDTDAFSSSHISRYLSRFINNNENDFVLFKKGEESTKELKQYIHTIETENNNKKSSYEMYIKACVYNILAFLHRNNLLVDIESLADYNTLNKVLPILEYIENNYQDPITLEFISSILNLNPFYFCRLFKKTTNSTFTEYLNFVRISKAESLLSLGEKSILEISLETGFSSVSYFNKTFKKYKNCTPTTYRKIKEALI